MGTLLLLLFTVLLFLLVYLALDKAVSELYSFILTNENGEKVFSFYSGIYEYLEERFPWITRHIDRAAAEEKLSGVMSELSVKASVWLARAAFSLPGILFFAVVTFLAAYYFAVDRIGIVDVTRSILPEKYGRTVEKFVSALKKSVRGYLRAGGYMMLITFFELLVGFLIIGTGFPFLLSLVTAAVDFLPVLGTGTVLIPMSLIYFITGSTGKGIGVIVLWAVTLLVRQFIEPKILGNSLGIHPLFSLFTSYVGFRLFGVSGLIFFPIGAAVCSGIWREWQEEK